MSRVMKLLRTLRTHKKKSIFAAVAASYGYVYFKEYYETQELMRVYCEKAAEYGRQPLAVGSEPRTVTVILNPNANRRKATKNFEKYCAPILHVAGVYVDIVQTESEGHARTLIENLSKTDAIVVAGGDGTLSEVVTGLLRRNDVKNSSSVPIGVLPLGKSNTIGLSLFPGGNHLSEVKSLAEAAMAVIQEATKPLDVMKIEILDDQDSEAPHKPIFALSGLRWGAFRDAETKQDKYWYFGPLRNYVTYVFNGYKNSLSWNCRAEVTLTPPCSGCSNCRRVPQVQVQKKWIEKFAPYKQQSAEPIHYAKIINDDCKNEIKKQIVTSDLEIVTTNTNNKKESLPQLQVKVGPKSFSYFDFVWEGWQLQHGKEKQPEECLQARQVKLVPLNVKEEKRNWFSIDNEDFEAKSVQITLFPDVIRMFCKLY